MLAGQAGDATGGVHSAAIDDWVALLVMTTLEAMLELRLLVPSETAVELETTLGVDTWEEEAVVVVVVVVVVSADIELDVVIEVSVGESLDGGLDKELRLGLDSVGVTVTVTVPTQEVTLIESALTSVCITFRRPDTRCAAESPFSPSMSPKIARLFSILANLLRKRSMVRSTLG